MITIQNLIKYNRWFSGFTAPSIKYYIDYSMEMINMQQYPLECSYKMQINKIGCLYFISLLFEADKHLQNYGKYRENADTATLTADRQTERS